MQFTTTIIVALLAVSTSPVTTAQKVSNLRGGGGDPGVGAPVSSDEVSAARKLQQEEETSDPQQLASESSTTLEAQSGHCPDGFFHDYSNDKCGYDQILCAAEGDDCKCNMCYTRKLEEEKGISNSPQLGLESSTTLEAQLGGCPGIDSHEEYDDDKCPEGQIRCYTTNPFNWWNIHYCHVL